MKKVLIFALSIILVTVSLYGTCFAKGTFIKSPSYHDDTIFDYEIPDGCDAVLKYTHFTKRNELSPESKKRIEDAYEILSTAKQISDVCPEITEKELAVSDLFDISYDPDFETENYHLDNEHLEIKIKLSSDVLKNFAYLLKYNGEEFTIVPNVRRDGNTISFFQSEVAAYILVVRTGGPGYVTGDSSIMWAVIIAGVCVIGIAATVIISKKNEIKE